MVALSLNGAGLRATCPYTSDPREKTPIRIAWCYWFAVRRTNLESLI
ncbi:hypothetical protein SBC2_32540 [Caballeronia sp. SBC2]|nr:hypothetical protein SBC2_32540 [Caballeronia sp. SBC2]